jgi:hypothetical protein
MSLRGNDLGFFERPGGAPEMLRRWFPAAQDTALMVSLAGGVCLSWPQVARSLVLVTKIVLYYCLSPR